MGTNCAFLSQMCFYFVIKETCIMSDTHLDMLITRDSTCRFLVVHDRALSSIHIFKVTGNSSDIIRKTLVQVN